MIPHIENVSRYACVLYSFSMRIDNKVNVLIADSVYIYITNFNHKIIKILLVRLIR